MSSDDSLKTCQVRKQSFEDVIGLKTLVSIHYWSQDIRRPRTLVSRHCQSQDVPLVVTAIAQKWSYAHLCKGNLLTRIAVITTGYTDPLSKVSDSAHPPFSHARIEDV